MTDTHRGTEVLRSIKLKKRKRWNDELIQTDLTLRPRNLLLRNCLRKYASRNVPNVSMTDRRAVFGWPDLDRLGVVAQQLPLDSMTSMLADVEAIKADSLVALSNVDRMSEPVTASQNDNNVSLSVELHTTKTGDGGG